MDIATCQSMHISFKRAKFDKDNPSVIQNLSEIYQTLAWLKYLIEPKIDETRNEAILHDFYYGAGPLLMYQASDIILIQTWKNIFHNCEECIA